MTAIDLKGAGEPDAAGDAARPGRVRDIRDLRAAWLTRATIAVGVLVLFFAYLGQARTMPTMSDGASQALQAWAMLHGNLLLHGWSLSDVSFYTTELPEYILVELVRGLTPDVVHVAAALTYTMLVILVGLLAKGAATGGAAVVRVLIATGIMLAPALGSLNTTFVVLAYPDHTGTQVPLLAIWLLLDRARPRWWVPAVVTLALAWVQVADTMALYEAALPLAAVCAIRCYRRIRPVPGSTRGPLPQNWYELALGIGAIGSIGVATATLRVIRLAGGFAVRTPGAGFARAVGLTHGLWTKVEHILVLYGADFFGLSLAHAIVPLIHLVGVGLAAGGVVAAMRRFFRADDLTLQILTASLTMVLVAFLLGERLGAWEAVGLLPLSAVLAGRLLDAKLTRMRLVPVLAAVLACYCGFLIFSSTRPAPFSPNERAAAFLAEHQLRYGLASYWEASSTTLYSRDHIQVRPVRTLHGDLLLTHWNAASSWYNWRDHDARFVIFKRCKGCLSLAGLRSAFGRPAHVYRVVNYQILVWNKNLLRGPFISDPPVSWDIVAGVDDRPGVAAGDQRRRGGDRHVREGRPDRHDAS